MAAALAANGARVVFADIDFDGAQRAAAACPGGRALRFDVTNEAEVERGVEEVVKLHGRLDILVNNAGVNTLAHRVNIDQFPTEEWDRILNVDLRGLFLVSRAAARQMIAQRSGRIINISSVLGLVLALELGCQGILVNCVAPGSIMTEGTKQLFYGPDGKFSDRVQSMLAHIPLGRPGEVAEVAHAVLFLAAPESSYINGTVLTVDGGWLAGYIREF
jgi:NAD(P)-dependent dehydrogenase (short-subunit alcohol dehydrogenase family)